MVKMIWPEATNSVPEIINAVERMVRGFLDRLTLANVGPEMFRNTGLPASVTKGLTDAATNLSLSLTDDDMTPVTGEATEDWVCQRSQSSNMNFFLNVSNGKAVYVELGTNTRIHAAACAADHAK